MPKRKVDSLFAFPDFGTTNGRLHATLKTISTHTMKDFKNIFFDLGGVLFNLNTRAAFRAFKALGMGIPDEIIADNQPLNGMPEGQEIVRLIHSMDLGKVRGTEFMEIVKRECRPGTTEAEILHAYNGMIEVPVTRLELLKRLRSKYKVYLLSNIGDLHWEAARNMAAAVGYPMEECFDHCFCSFEMGVAKPDPLIFERAIAESGVVPEETLYIDDFDANIEAGRRAGLLAYKIVGNTLEQHVPILFPEFC